MEIPLYSSVAAGLGSEIYSEPTDWIEVPEESGDIIAITVSGVSMENTILDGAIVIVKRGEAIEVGEIGIFFTTDGEYKNGLVKRLRSKDENFVLESDNSMYEDILLEETEIKAFGKVITIINDTKKKKKDEIAVLVENFSEEKRELIKEIDKLTSEEIEILKKCYQGFPKIKKNNKSYCSFIYFSINKNLKCYCRFKIILLSF